MYSTEGKVLDKLSSWNKRNYIYIYTYVFARGFFMRDRVVEVSELGLTFMELLCGMELEAELEDLEHAELEERLLQPWTTQLPPVPVPVPVPVPAYSGPMQVPPQRVPQKCTEDAEVAALRAEMTP
jgi:hypothetical protein